MTALAKLRRVARPFAFVIAALAAMGSTNAYSDVHQSVTATEECHSAQHAQNEAPAASLSEHEARPEIALVSSCCEQHCKCPSVTAHALPVLTTQAPTSISSHVRFPPILPPEDRRPSDLLRPPI
jgi:hypothetical protein